MTRAVNAGRKCKRCPGACRLIDSALERTRLVVRTAGADPELAGVDSETLPMVIYAIARRGVNPVVNAISALIVVGFGSLILISQRLRTK